MPLSRHLPATLVAAALLLAPAARGQSRRETQPLLLVPEAQAELALRNGDYLLLALRGQRDTGLNRQDGRALGFDERRLTLGYEHFWNEHWSWGGTLRGYSLGFDQYTLVPEVLLRHRGAVGPLTFGQRLGVERQLYIENRDGGPDRASENWVRLRLDLEKVVSLGTLALRPRLSYEAATHLRLQKADTDPDERFIQYGLLRAEAGLRVSPRFDLTPWFAYQTIYTIALPQTDGMGQVTIPGGNLNQVAPAVGLDLRLTIFPGGTEFERQQLPTQH